MTSPSPLATRAGSRAASSATCRARWRRTWPATARRRPRRPGRGRGLRRRCRPAPSSRGPRGEGGDRGVVGDVEGHGPPADGAGTCLEPVEPAGPADHLEPGLGEAPGRGRPDAGAGAGDHRHAAGLTAGRPRRAVLLLGRPREAEVGSCSCSTVRARAVLFGADLVLEVGEGLELGLARAAVRHMVKPTKATLRAVSGSRYSRMKSTTQSMGAQLPPEAPHQEEPAGRAHHVEGEEHRGAHAGRAREEADEVVGHDDDERRRRLAEPPLGLAHMAPKVRSAAPSTSRRRRRTTSPAGRRAGPRSAAARRRRGSTRTLEVVGGEQQVAVAGVQGDEQGAGSR